METEIESVLRETVIPNNSKRANVSGLRYYGNDNRKYGFPIKSMTLGLVRDYQTGGKTISKFTKTNEKLWDLLCEYAKKNDFFKFESICINYNVRCLPHRDKYNKNLSLIVGFGNYTGGELGIITENMETLKINIFHKPHIFDGNLIHYTEPFEGDRWSVIFH